MDNGSIDNYGNFYVIHKARKVKNNFGKQTDGSLIDTLTDHAKRKCFFANALKKRKNANSTFQHIFLPFSGKKKCAEIFLPALLVDSFILKTHLFNAILDRCLLYFAIL